MAVTIRDVAQSSGVSIATVSRVINNSPDVAQPTRQRVETVITELGYNAPTPSLRSLQKALRTIALLMSDITNVHFPSVIRGMEEHLFHHDYSLLVCNTGEDPSIERRYIAGLQDKGVEAVAFVGTRLANSRHEHIVELSERMPVVMIDDYLVGESVYSVMVDETEGAYKATDHLVRLGHRRIGYVRGDGDYTTSDYKCEGYKRALAHHGITLDDGLVVRVDPHEDGGHEAGERLLTMAQPPTAVFSENDQLATGIMQAAYELGRTIPGDLSLVGFSDSPIAAHLYPPLTTVNQFASRVGELAAQTLLSLIRKEPLVQRRMILQPELVVRQSTGPVVAGSTGNAGRK